LATVNVDGRIILKLVLKNSMLRYGLVRMSRDRLVTVVGSCEHRNESSDSIQGEEFLDQLSRLLICQKGACSKDFVNSFSINLVEC
jgi:hypothetical protein